MSFCFSFSIWGVVVGGGASDGGGGGGGGGDGGGTGLGFRLEVVGSAVCEEGRVVPESVGADFNFLHWKEPESTCNLEIKLLYWHYRSSILTSAQIMTQFIS